MNNPDPKLWLLCTHCGTLSNRNYSPHCCMTCGFPEDRAAPKAAGVQ